MNSLQQGYTICHMIALHEFKLSLNLDITTLAFLDLRMHFLSQFFKLNQVVQGKPCE